MEKDRPSIRGTDVPTIALIPFVLITFGITWGTVGVFIFFPEQACGLVR